jgi:hypothetical protein
MAKQGTWRSGWSWLLAVVLVAFAAVLIAAFLIARRPPGSASPTPAQPEGPDVAGRVTYGEGIDRVVQTPITELTPVLGSRWHLLSAPRGSVAVLPTGRPTRFFQLSAVVASPRGPARLALLTANGERGLASVGHPGIAVINFGPLRVTNRGALPLALFSIQASTKRQGPPLVISPLQAVYLRAGEAVRRMPAIAEPGPGGLRGITVFPGDLVRLAITPGLQGRCGLLIHAVAREGDVVVSAIVGGVMRKGLILRHPTLLYLGPYPRTSKIVRIRVSRRGRGGSRVRVLLGDSQLVPAQ